MSATGLRRKLALVAGGTLVGLLLAEVLLRLAAPQPTGVLALVNDPDLLVANEPDASGFVSIPGIYRHTFSHDAEGRRRTTSPGPGPEVMILGDSFAYGMGVDDDETVASRLGEVLRQRGMPVTVTDAGVPGVGSPVHALRLLQTHGAVWRPDVAVFLFYPNDFANVWWQSYYEVTPDSILPRRPTDLNSTRRTAIMSHPLFRYVRAHSHLSGLLWQFAVDHIGQNPPPSADTDTTRAPVPWSFPEAEAPMLRFLTALRDELAARGTPMILAYAPTASEVAQYRRQPGMSVDGARVAVMREALGIDGLDLTPLLAARPEPVGALYYPEIHWQAVSHAVAARELADPVQAALCARDLTLQGCDQAPEAVRRIAETRADAARAGSSRRTPAG